MCKIITLTNLSKLDRQSFNKLASTSAKLLGRSEKDGFGFSVMTSSGVISQRYVNPNDVRPDLVQGKKLSFTNPVMNQTGAFSFDTQFTGGAFFHGRVSTNTKSLNNTHPINKHGWSLIHNGVVTDHGPKYDMITSNDTEHCLERLVQGIAQVEQHITGYYALAAFSPDNNLHIVRDSIAQLFCAYVDTIDSLIFATTQDLINETCKAMSWSYDSIQKVMDNVYLIFDQSGQLLSQVDIKPRGYDDYSMSKSELSLGKKWQGEWKDDNLLYLDQSSEVTDLENEQLFLEEIASSADHTWVFINNRSGRKIDLEKFLYLDEKSMIEDFTVVRADGTICCPVDYYTDRLYEGKAM
jgi:predicted glutamine amidotransferase